MHHLIVGMIFPLLIFTIALSDIQRSSSCAAFPMQGSRSLLKNVFTNLTHSFAGAIQFELSSAVSQGALKGNKLGSAGAKVGNRVGAATSYGVGQLEFMRISIGVSAAKAKTSEAVSKVFQSQLGRSRHRSLFHRFKRDDVSASTSLNEVTGIGAKSVMGSTGIVAGPVATSISLGSVLLAARNSFSAVNAGALAAHAGRTQASNAFSNSNIGSDTSITKRNSGKDDEADEVENDKDEIVEPDENEDKKESEDEEERK